jgi:hypothetical protein
MSLASAALMMTGAAVFEEVIEHVAGSVLPKAWYSKPVIYLVDAASMIPAEDLWQRTLRVAGLLVEMATDHAGLRRYLDADPPVAPMGLEDAMSATRQSGFVASWRTTERAVPPGPVADLIASAVTQRGIPLEVGRVVSVSPSPQGWCVGLENAGPISARGVVNCLWESRAAIDRQVVATDVPVCIRYKAGLFGFGTPAWASVEPSTRILGAFGDVTPYGNGDVYLNWYPVGMLGRSDSGEAPVVPAPDEAALRRATLAGLGLDPEGPAAAPGWEVHGGFIVARGWGEITDRVSPLHDRSAPDASVLAPGYVTLDTGKYSLGPLLATRAAELSLRSLRRHG